MSFRISAAMFLFLSLASAQERVLWSHAQGHGYYPMVVSVREAGSEKPIQGAKVQMQEDERLLPAVDAEPEKTIRKAFYDVCQTDKAGLVALHYAARFSEYSSGAHFRNIRGIVVIEADGFESAQIDLHKWQTERGYCADSYAAFSVWISMKRKGEPPGAAQPTAKPVDKAPEKVQPSPPTPKGGPR